MTPGTETAPARPGSVGLATALGVAALGAVALVGTAPAHPVQTPTDWNQWRGPGRDGRSPVALPDVLPGELELVWETAVGTGHASPVVVDDVAFAFGRVDGREVIRALEIGSGSTVWSAEYPAPYEVNPAARGHGPGPKSTPAVVDGRVFTLGIGGVLSAWDAGDGNRLWQHDFRDRFARTSPNFGAAMSPLVAGGRVVAHVGGPGDGALAAFDVETGEISWELQLDGPAYASPILVEIDGVSQLITQSRRQVVGVGFAAGELLWSLPLRTSYDQNVVTPVAWEQRLVLGGLDHPTVAVRPVRAADDWQVRELWSNDEAPVYMSSPVRVGDRLFGMTHRRAGQFFALDLDTGEFVWRSEGREGENAAVVAAGQRVLFLTDGAELVVVDARASDYRPLARYMVADSPTWAHPVLTPSGLLVRDRAGLALWSFGDDARTR